MSFPTRERGLKSVAEKNTGDGNQSFPTRERGLKSLMIKRQYMYVSSSFPTRERGLKSQQYRQ